MSNVNHPSHYQLPNGIEVIDIVQSMDFCRGNAIKYLCRAGQKDPEKEIEDLEKAAWYIREIEMMSETKPEEDNDEKSHTVTLAVADELKFNQTLSDFINDGYEVLNCGCYPDSCEEDECEVYVTMWWAILKKECEVKI